MTLEDALREAIAKEGLSHLTFAPSQGRWQAAFKRKPGAGESTTGYRVAIMDDPVDALIEALVPGSVKVDDNSDILDLIG